MKQTDHLRLSATFSLPLAFAASRNMVLAQSGAGKSNTCVVIAEEMHRIRFPWVAVDTKGDWYGVRSSRDGKSRGLDVPVFGGEFGDIPLSPLAGARMAELVAAGKFSGVLDVSDFPKISDVSKFLIDFAGTLLKKQRTPVHLFLEECADYLPQGGYRGQTDPLAAACVGAMKRLATKGRFRGIGYTLISQRAAEVNKTVLYQCETLIAHRMVGDLDIKWIEGWIKRGSKRAGELIDVLPDLQDGECWVWSPQRLKITERLQVRRRDTFDSGAPPEIGKARVAPKMAPVEIEALRKELADLEEQAKADDPRVLKARIAELEKALKNPIHVPGKLKGGATATGPLDKFDVAVDRRHLEETVAASEAFETELVVFEKAMRAVRMAANGAVATVRRARQSGPAALAKRLEKAGPAPVEKTRSLPSASLLRTTPKVTNGTGTAIGGGLRRMMIALARRPRGLTNRQLGVRAGLSSNSGTFSTYLSKGRSEGWIFDDGKTRKLTEEGLSVLGNFDPLPEGRELLEYWVSELGGGTGRMLAALAESYPKPMTNAELGAAAGISHGSGTFSTYLSKLRTLELVEGRGELRMSEELA